MLRLWLSERCTNHQICAEASVNKSLIPAHLTEDLVFDCLPIGVDRDAVARPLKDEQLPDLNESLVPSASHIRATLPRIQRIMEAP